MLPPENEINATQLEIIEEHGPIRNKDILDKVHEHYLDIEKDELPQLDYLLRWGRTNLKQRKIINNFERGVWSKTSSKKIENSLESKIMVKKNNEKEITKVNNMRIVKVELVAIKNSKETEQYIFESNEENVKINTISGANGSGKTSLFESIYLIQKFYFFKQLSERDNNYSIIKQELFNELNRMFIETDSRITGVFEVNDEEISISLIQGEIGHFFLKFEDKESEYFFEKNWSIKNPKNIICYLPADRNVVEQDIKFSNIKIDIGNDVSPIINSIFSPKNTYHSLYSIIMNDYIYYRLNNRHDIKYYQQARKLTKDIFPNLEIKNFSAVKNEGELVLLVINDATSMKKNRYDIRGLSSGEKLVFYLTAYINYVKSIGVLIIDEPENHLHEESLNKLLFMLRGICYDADKNIAVHSIYLLTHSKNLIYNTFSIGSNYLLSNNELNYLGNQDAENKLRKMGLSNINQKILFVEGDTEVELFTEIFAEKNIKIRQLANCDEVINVFSNIKKIYSELNDPEFVFLIDKDTKDADFFNKEENSNYFKKHFVVLDRHELENYFLEEDILFDVCEEIDCGVYESSTEILEIMKKESDKVIDDVRVKYLNQELNNGMNEINSVVKRSEIKKKLNDLETYKEFLKKNVEEKLNEIIDGAYNSVDNKYTLETWDLNWKYLTDGKKVYNMTLSEIAKKLNVKPAHIKKKLYSRALSKEKNYDITLLIDELLIKFDKLND